jgi:hypothetical protein
MFRLESTVARLKFKGIDGDFCKRWSMLFNSIVHANLTNFRIFLILVIDKKTGLHGCRQFVLQNVRLSPFYERNPYPIFIFLEMIF